MKFRETWGQSTGHCGDCSWFAADDGQGRCRMAAPEGEIGPRVDANTPACGHKETDVGCDDCGACCREAFDSVPVYRDKAQDKETARLHPTLIREHDDGWRDLHRVPTVGCKTACIALHKQEGTYMCTIYADRPTTCRDLKVGSDGCLFARRRVGLSVDPRSS